MAAIVMETRADTRGRPAAPFAVSLEITSTSDILNQVMKTMKQDDGRDFHGSKDEAETLQVEGIEGEV